jgi:hypothetical protein
MRMPLSPGRTDREGPVYPRVANAVKQPVIPGNGFGKCRPKVDLHGRNANGKAPYVCRCSKSLILAAFGQRGGKRIDRPSGECQSDGNRREQDNATPRNPIRNGPGCDDGRFTDRHPSWRPG